MNINLSKIVSNAPKARLTYNQLRGLNSKTSSDELIKEYRRIKEAAKCKDGLEEVREHRMLRDLPKYEGGKKYYGFTYFPRFPDEKDPPHEPTKLFLVERIAPMLGLTKVEKKIIEDFNINGEKNFQGHIGIVKNTPQMNALLWRVKHVVKITPIKFVNGLPKDGDYTGCWLKENGDFIVSPKLQIDQERIKSSYDFKNDRKRLDRDTIKKRLRLEWQGPFFGVTE